MGCLLCRCVVTFKFAFIENSLIRKSIACFDKAGTIARSEFVE